MEKRFSSLALALTTFASFSLLADGEVEKGALGGAATGALVGGLAGGGRGAGIGAATGLGIGLLGGAIAKSDRKKREREDAAAYYSRQAHRRYNPEVEIDILTEENEDLRDQASRLQRIITTKENKIQALDAQIENLQVQNQELRDNLRAQRKTHATDIADIKSANLALKKELTKIKKDLATMKKKIKKDSYEEDDDETEMLPVMVK